MDLRHTIGPTSRYLALSLALSLEALLRRENNKFNIYKKTLLYYPKC